MKERPIIFSGESVRAIIEGRKTQTRRVCKFAQSFDGAAYAVCPARISGWIAWFSGRPSPNIAEFTKAQYDHGFDCPHGSPGDRLWVREYHWINETEGLVAYLADGKMPEHMTARWRSPIYMPRKFSRLTLEITDVRVQRLQEIKREDLWAEAAGDCEESQHEDCFYGTHGKQCRFEKKWDRINKRHPWASNPWVWCISFRAIEGRA